MQNTSTQIVTTEAKGSWLRRLTVFMLILLIIEFITGQITSHFVTLPAAHPGAASSGFSGFVSGLGWALTQSRLLALQVHGAIGLLLVLLALVLLGLAMVRRQRSWVITSLIEQGLSYVSTARQVGLTERNLRKWVKRWSRQGPAGLSEQPRPGRLPVISPEIALYVVKLACERPDRVGRSLAQWDCAELARQLRADGLVESIAPKTIRGSRHFFLPKSPLRCQRALGES